MLLSLVLFSFIFFLTSWLNRTRTRTNRKCEPSAGISLQLTIFEFMFQFCWTSFKKKCQKCPCDSVLNYWHHTVQKIFKISKLYCTTKCREKRETTINIPRSISFSPLHFVFYLGKSITFGTVHPCRVVGIWNLGSADVSFRCIRAGKNLGRSSVRCGEYLHTYS